MTDEKARTDLIGPVPPTRARQTAVILGGLLALHVLGYAVGIWRGWLPAVEPFHWLLVAFNVAFAVGIWRRGGDVWLGAGVLVLVMAHGFAGHRMAPDFLTSGAVLTANLLVLYVGLQVQRHLPLVHWLLFAVGYFALFGIFVGFVDNAEPLFIMALFGLCATARSLRLTAYFWVVVLAFAVCQPFQWETVCLGFLVLTGVFGARARIPSPTALVFLGAGTALLALVLLPIVIVMMGEDLHNLATVLGDRRLREAIRLTVLTATGSTLALVLFGVPLAYALSRLRFPGRGLLLALIDLPIVIPQSAAGLALLHVLGRRQVLGGAFHDLTGVPIDGTVLGICLAQVFVALPFLCKSALSAFEAVDEDLELTARTLGASSWGAFWRVACPLAARGIFVGAVLAWARAAGEFGALVFIAPTPETAPVAAWNRFHSVGMVETAPLVAALLMFSLGMFLLLQWAQRWLPNVSAEGRP